MKMNVFAIKDKALNCYGPLFNSPTVESGIRTFRDVVLFGEENNRYRRSPQDYDLYLIGTYDDEKGELAASSPTLLMSAEAVLDEIQQRSK